jgi:hypothetical protein
MWCQAGSARAGYGGAARDAAITSVSVHRSRSASGIPRRVSGLGSTIDDYTRLCPRSTIGEGLAVRCEEITDARADVEVWLRRVGLL